LKENGKKLTTIGTLGHIGKIEIEKLHDLLIKTFK
jgi:hypothetical protein